MRRDTIYYCQRILVELLFHFLPEFKSRWLGRICQQYERRALRKLVARINREHPGGWIFLMAPAIGDDAIIYSLFERLKNEKGGDISVVVQKKMQAELAGIFKSVDSIYMFDDSIAYYYALRDQMYPFAATRSKLSRTIAFGANGIVFDDPREQVFLDRFRLCLGLDGDHAKIDVKAKGLLRRTREQQPSGADDKTIFVVPGANSMKLGNATEDFWLSLAGALELKGYKVIFNAASGEYGRYDCKFLSLSQLMPFVRDCKCVIGLRCGLLDWCAYCDSKKIIALYPARIDHPTLGRSRLEALKSNCPRAWDPNRSDDENFREFFSMHNIFENSEFIVEKVIDSGGAEDVQRVVDAIA